jgi:hypothetical protein
MFGETQVIRSTIELPVDPGQKYLLWPATDLSSRSELRAIVEIQIRVQGRE